MNCLILQTLFKFWLLTRMIDSLCRNFVSAKREGNWQARTGTRIESCRPTRINRREAQWSLNYTHAHNKRKWKRGTSPVEGGAALDLQLHPLLAAAACSPRLPHPWRVGDEGAPPRSPVRESAGPSRWRNGGQAAGNTELHQTAGRIGLPVTANGDKWLDWGVDSFLLF